GRCTGPVAVLGSRGRPLTTGRCRWPRLGSPTHPDECPRHPDRRQRTGRKRPMAAAAGDREKALEAALANSDKQYGKGSVMRLGDDTRPPLEVIPTGAISLDVALGIGGLPRGRVVEIYGPESSGKTTVAL